MEVHVLNNNQQVGPFPAAAVAEMAKNGALSASAMVWHDGAAGWYPLSEFLARPEMATLAAATEPEARPMSMAEVSQELIRQKRAALDAEAENESALVFKALGAGFGVALLGGVLYFLTFLLTKPFVIPGPIIVIGMAVGATITKVGRGEGSALLPLCAVLFTLMAYLMVGFPHTGMHLMMLAMGLFMAFKLSYL